MVTNRETQGGSALGCMSSIALLVVGVYLAVIFGQPWFRYRQFQDQMKTSARFAVTIPDSVIRIRLTSLADSLGLPRGAKKLSIVRNGLRQRITISVTYDEVVKVPLLGPKTITFRPKAEERL